MIVLLLFLIGALAAFGSSSPSGPQPVGPVTPAPTCGADGCTWHLSSARLTWSGGFTGQPEQSATVTDAAGLAKLDALLPETLPDTNIPPTGCADCYEYVLDLQFEGAAPRTYSFDDASMPQSLQALVQALRGPG